MVCVSIYAQGVDIKVHLLEVLGGIAHPSNRETSTLLQYGA
jgi:hypothetical protein